MTERINLTQYQRERLKRKTEDKVEDEIKAWLRTQGRPYSKTNAERSLNVYGQRVQRVRKGWPDLTTMTATGRFFAIECKRAIGGTLARDQALILRKIHNAGGLICIARSVEDVQDAEANGTRQRDLDEIDRAIKRPVKGAYADKLIDESVNF